MNYPKINIITDDSDILSASYFCFLAKEITIHLFQNGNYYVVPKKNLTNLNSNTVYFPHLPYSKKFWRRIVDNPNNNFNSLYPKPCLDEITNLLKKEVDNEKLKKQKIKKDWQKIEKVFFKTVFSILEIKKEISKLSVINILITPFGTRGSFYVQKKASKLICNLTSRTDYPASNIGKNILHIIYLLKENINTEIGNEGYIKRMAIVDFLIKHSKLASFFEWDKSFSRTNVKDIKALANESKKYLKKLGFAKENNDLDKVMPLLTNQEKQVMLKLIKANGKIVTFDAIDRAIWKNKIYDKFSLAAISKTVQNLRVKIAKAGIYKNLIHTVRNEGFFLEK